LKRQKNIKSYDKPIFFCPINENLMLCGKIIYIILKYNKNKKQPIFTHPKGKHQPETAFF